MVLGRRVQFLHELLAALLRQRGNRQTDNLPIVPRVEAQVGDPNGFFDDADLRDVPRLNSDEGRLGYVQVRDLIQRGGRIKNPEGMTLTARTFGTTAGVMNGALEERAAQYLAQVGDSSHESVSGRDGALVCHQY